MQRSVLSLACLTIALAASGCMDVMGDSTHDVSVQDSKFDPISLTVDQNAEVTWTNDGTQLHAIQIHKGGDAPTTLKKDTDLAEGTSTTFRFEETGTYHVFCEYHSAGRAGTYENGMVMTVTVEA